MGYKTTSTKISSAKTTRSRQTTTYQNPSAAGVVVTGKAVTAETSIFLDIAAPGSARSVTPVTGGGGATITSITYLDADNLPTNANAVSTTGGNILIVGTGFSTNSRVFVNNVQVTNTYINSSAIRATLSSSTVGNVGLYLFSSANTSGALSSNAVRFSGAPVWVTGTSISSYNNLASNIQLQATGDGTLTYSLKSGSGSLPNGISLLSTGYLTGTATGYTVDTTVQFTLIVTDSENQATQQTFNYSVLLGDTYFNQTTLLLNADQGNTFVTDSSTNNFQVNVVGGAGPSRFTPFSANGYSAYFDGSGDYLSIAHTTANDIGTGDFTIEGWVYPNSNASLQSMFGWWDFASGQGGLILGIESTAAVLYWAPYSEAAPWLQGGTVIPRAWNHIALTRASNTFTIYLNGVSVATGSNSGTKSNLISYNIGAYGNTGGLFTGFISNLRVIKGTALYTANFTPSTTALSTVANTSLLTLRDSVLADDSPNNFTITRNGDVKLVQFSPLNAYTLTPNSYSVYFDGTGDYLTIPENANFNIATSQSFTVEGWFYTTSTTQQTIFNICDTGTSGYGAIRLQLLTNQQLQWLMGPGGSWGLNITAGTVSLNTWTHFAFVRNTDTVLFFVNGTQVGSSTTYSSSLVQDRNSFIGFNSGVGYPYVGHISNFRFVKGTAVYTANFTPSTTALTSIANTSILTCQSTTIIDSNTTPKTITINGNPNVSAANPFYETVTAINNYSYDSTTYGASAYFDGGSDCVTAPANAEFTLGASDLTVEFWWYGDGASVNAYATHFKYSSGVTQQATNDFYLNMGSAAGGFINVLVGSGGAWGVNMAPGGATYYNLSINNWNHIAVTRSGSTWRLFWNGQQISTATYAGNISAQSGSMVIGSSSAAGADSVKGYISNFRFIKGTALYTGTFVPPTAPLTVVANTRLLTLQNSLGANSAQFLDESINSYVVTRAGNAAQGSFSPLVPASWSAYFDGSGDYLTVPDNAAWTIDSNYTIEAWVYATSFPGVYNQVVSQRSSSTVYWSLNWNTTNGWTFLYNNGSGETQITRNQNSPLNTWIHVALVKSGTTGYIFLNGTQAGATFTFPNISYNNSLLYIGVWPLITDYFNGYISNLRVVKGTALYTANFTPASSSLTTVANTSLLTLQNPTIQDNSPNNFTITRNGDTKIVPFGPFVPHAVIPDSYSYYFRGTSDYISTANANLAFGTSDFTVETWVYNRFGSNNGICQISNVQYGLSNTSTNTVALGLVNNKVVVRANNAIYTSTGTNVTANTWNHLALTRASNIAKLYINGTLDTTIGSSGSITDSTNYTGTNLAIGGYLTTSVLANAYISNFRTVKGTAVYTENFTVNTAPLTAVANTVVLTAQSNTIVDTASVNTFTGNGNTSPRVFNPFGSTTTQGIDYNPLEHGGSVYFDGTGDYLTIPSNPSLSLGGGSFTVECWVYISGAQTQNFGHSIVGTYPGSGNGWNLTINRSSTALGIQWINGSPSAILFTYGTYIPNNTWTHIAIVRSSTATNGIRAYVNGALVATGTDSTNDSVLQTLYIGAQGPSSCYFPGYISNLRILKGTALYTSNFVPPASPPTPTANTSILMNFTNSGVVDSGYRSILETVGDARMTNTIKKYNSGSYVFDGTGDYMRVKSVNTDMYAFGIGDFTIEMWIYPNLAQTAGLIDFRPTSTNGAYIYINITSTQTKLYVNSADVITGGALTAGVWTHIALTRSGTSTKLFLNGVQSGSTYTDSTNYLCGSERPSIGMSGFGADSVLNGYIDDLRITKGYARYTANFTPPAVAFPDL